MRPSQARKAPTRALYYRRNADCDRLIQACTAKLEAEPSNIRALLIRAASYTKKGTQSLHKALLQLSSAGCCTYKVGRLRVLVTQYQQNVTCRLDLPVAMRPCCLLKRCSDAMTMPLTLNGLIRNSCFGVCRLACRRSARLHGSPCPDRRV